MLGHRWVAIDFETATREPTSACALGVAVVEGLDVVETHSWLIRPPFNEYEYRNTIVHGLSAEDTELAPDFDELWWEVRAIIDGSPLLAHNAGFDMRVLGALISSRELATPPLDYACTLTVARRIWPRLENHRLDTVCRHCAIGLVHHDAASDAAACAGLAVSAARSLGVASVTGVLDELGLEPKRLAT